MGEPIARLVRDGDVATVTVRGELDLAAVPDLREVLEQAEHTQARLTVIDLQGVSFADSAVLGALLGAHKRATSRGGAVALCGVQPALERVLALTMLDRVFEIHPDAATAIELMTQP